MSHLQICGWSCIGDTQPRDSSPQGQQGGQRGWGKPWCSRAPAPCWEHTGVHPGWRFWGSDPRKRICGCRSTRTPLVAHPAPTVRLSLRGHGVGRRYSLENELAQWAEKKKKSINCYRRGIRIEEQPIPCIFKELEHSQSMAWPNCSSIHLRTRDRYSSTGHLHQNTSFKVETLHVECMQEPLVPCPSEQGHRGHVPGVGATGAPRGLAWQGLWEAAWQKGARTRLLLLERVWHFP